MEILVRAQQFFMPPEKRDVQLKLSKSRHTSSFRSRYGLGKVLGKGTYSVVRMGVDLASRETVAVKCIDEVDLSDKDAQSLQREVNLLKKLKHPNIIDFKQFYYDQPERMYYIVTGYCGGGELFDAIVSKVYYSEQMARKIIFTLSGAIKYCHDRNIVHRDLKPENILLETREENGDFEVEKLKIADFGFAKYLKKDCGLTTICGSPLYVSPEIINRSEYGKAVDIWSLGVITYIILCGFPPFNDSNTELLFGKIKLGKFTFDEQYWSNVSSVAKDLIVRMLNVNPKGRLTIDEVLNHPWLTMSQAQVYSTQKVEVLSNNASDVSNEDDLSGALSELRKLQNKQWKLPTVAIRAMNKLKRHSNSS